MDKREDEKTLWAAVLNGEYPRDAGLRLEIPANRLRYLCYKWADKGIYQWGVTYDLGWPFVDHDNNTTTMEMNDNVG